MKITSNKQEYKSLSFINKFWIKLTEDFHKTAIVMFVPLIIYFLFDASDTTESYFALGATLVMLFIVGLMTQGELFDNLKGTAWIFTAIFLSIHGLIWALAPIKTEVHTMDLKPYILTIDANEDKNEFLMKLKLPFEPEIEINLSYSRYNKLFSNPEYFKEFTIIAKKECSVYKFMSISCDRTMEIKHKDSTDIIFHTNLYESIYPHKLQIELDYEAEQSEE